MILLFLYQSNHENYYPYIFINAHNETLVKRKITEAQNFFPEEYANYLLEPTFILPDTSNHYYNIAMEYAETLDYEQAENYLNIAINKLIISGSNDGVDICILYNALGIIKMELCEYEESLENFLKALYIFKNINYDNRIEIADIYDNVAFLHMNMNNRERALEYLYHSLTIREGLEDIKNIELAKVYNNIADIYQYKDEYNSAEDFYRKALEVKLKLEDNDLKGIQDQDLGSKTESYNIAITQNNYALVHFSNEKYDEAIELLD